MIQQQYKEKMTEYATRYKTTKEIMESRFGKLNMTNSMSNTDEYKAAETNLERKEIVEDAYQRVVAYDFLMSSNLDKARQLNKELTNDYAKGDNKYPENLEKAVEMLENYRAPVAFNNKYNKTRDNCVKREQVGFLQATPEQDGSIHSHITCNKCKKKEHYANQCPGDNGSTTNAQAEHENNRNQDDNDSDANEDISNNGNDNEENQTRGGTQHTSVTRWNLLNTGKLN